MTAATIIVIVLLLIFVGFIICIFNKIMKSSTSNIEAFYGVDEVLKKRFALISNIEELINNYASGERYILERIEQVKKNLSEKMTISDREKHESKYSILIRDILLQADNYPNLKEDENFINFKQHLTEIEEEIEVARRHYNDTSRSYNALIKKSPNNVLCSILGYSARPFFDLDLFTRTKEEITFADRRQRPRESQEE